MTGRIGCCDSGGSGPSIVVDSGQWMPEYSSLEGATLVENGTAWTYSRIGNVWHVAGIGLVTVDTLPFEVSFNISLPFTPAYPPNSMSGVLTGTSVPDGGEALHVAGIVRGAGPTTLRAYLSAGYWNAPGTVPIAFQIDILGFPATPPPDPIPE